MKPNEYISNALNTKSDHYDSESVHPDVVHAAMGCVTEAGELMDVCKRAFFYGKGKAAVDQVNLVEEFGDLLWYVAIGLNALGVDFEQAMEANIKKLAARYPEKFQTQRAHERNLGKERGILEESTSR